MTLDWTQPVSDLLEILQNHGVHLEAVCDGHATEAVIGDTPAQRTAHAAAIICSVDMSWLSITKERLSAHLCIVLGNEPDELVADYSCGRAALPLLEEQLDPVLELFRQQWEGRACPRKAEGSDG